MKNIRIAFFGTAEFSKSVLEALYNEKYNISLVLYGHHHHYERFQYNGHIYICLGGGGGQQFGSNFFRPTKYTEKFVMGPTYTIISIKNDKMEITTKTAEKDIVDYYEIKANLS